MKIKITVKNERETKKLGQILGRKLFSGAVIELIGPLGSGKTTLARAILLATGVAGASSPTFILDAVYKPKKNKDIAFLHHLDLYRLKNSQELVTLGVYDFIGKAGTATIIEWADRFPILRNHGKLTIEIVLKNEKERIFKMVSSDPKHDILLQNIPNNFN